MSEVGYITDVEYTGSFFAQQLPAVMNYIATVNGYATPPLESDFAYCELGCGRGVTSLILAATHPQARVYACDVNPIHVNRANAVAAQAKLGNANFLDRDFAQMLHEELPDFDFITAHGVYSWVPEQVREQIHAFLQRKLKPGGLAMLSYNAMPGWAHLQPVRRMMHTYAASLPGDSIHRARQALAYVNFLSHHKAQYFATNPAADAHVKTLGANDLRYVAHEYMTPHGYAFYFSEVAEALRKIGLSFAGNMVAAGNYSISMVPTQFQEFLKTAPNRTIMETHRDFIANTAFRNDLYAAQPELPIAHGVAFARLASMHFCIGTIPDRLALNGSHLGVDYDLSGAAESVRAVHALLESGPANGDAIHRVANRATRGETAVLLQQLVLAGHIAPCPTPKTKPGWPAINRALLQAALAAREDKVDVAVPLNSNAQTFDVMHAVLIEAALSHASTDAAARAAASRLTEQGYQVNRLGSAGHAAPATLEELQRDFSQAIDSLRDPKHVDGQFARQLGLM